MLGLLARCDEMEEIRFNQDEPALGSRRSLVDRVSAVCGRNERLRFVELPLESVASVFPAISRRTFLMLGL